MSEATEIMRLRRETRATVAHARQALIDSAWDYQNAKALLQRRNQGYFGSGWEVVDLGDLREWKK